MNNVEIKYLVQYLFFKKKGGVILAAVLTGYLLIKLSVEPAIPVFIGLISFPIIILCFLRPKLPIILLLLSIMFTEFYWVEVMGGYLKPFHIASVIMILTFTIFYLDFLKLSKIFWLFILFILICLISIAFSGDWQESLRSFILPLLLFSIAINIGIALYSQRINQEIFGRIILYGSLITVLFGLLQMLSYASIGLLLTLTEIQNGQIIIAKRPPSFFTEADTFGKFLSLPFLFFLPFTLDKNNKYCKKMKILAVIFLLGIVVNMTRSALIGIGVATIFYITYLLKRKSIARNIAVIYGLAASLIIIVPFFFATTKVVGSHEEFAYRLQGLMSPSVMITEDPSALYRKKGVEETLEGSVESLSAFLIGHGWGSAIISTRGEPKDVGGTLFVNILYFSGIFALMIYLLICVMVIRLLLKVTKDETDLQRRLFAEGILLSFIGMLTISQLASMWIAPEFWLVIGCSIYLELKSKKGDM